MSIYYCRNINNGRTPNLITLFKFTISNVKQKVIFIENNTKGTDIEYTDDGS